MDLLRAFQFRLRNEALGRLKLRASAPKLASAVELSGELAFYRLILDRGIDPTSRTRVEQYWDIGCRNWSYVDAFETSFPKARQGLGIELDGYRRYWNLHRRIDVAQAHAKQASAKTGRLLEAICADFTSVKNAPEEWSRGVPSAFCFLFPFVSPHPCERWGLPKRFADFSRLLKHSLELAKNQDSPETVLFSAHQGDWESEIAIQAYQTLGLNPQLTVIQPEEWREAWPMPHEVHCLQASVKSPDA